MRGILVAIFASLLSFSTVTVNGALPEGVVNEFYIVQDTTCDAAQKGSLIGMAVPHTGAACTSSASMLVWTGPKDNQFKSLEVNKDHVELFKFDVSSLKEKTMDEILEAYDNGQPLVSYHYRDLTSDEKVYLTACSKALTGLGTPDQILQNTETENKARLIGASICHKHGREGMIFAAEVDRKYLRHIEHAWNGICGWQQ